ncbi:hypothetical protein DUI87_23356 [Hirundo rustica rustica]|uniref:Uncharacterized protein n=1 Tax=Hirundo rustica rustica TaxID=333673 RepID=A0A3M0JFQ9_HIRRU|nr:hypothetical protein DUI87_23356 [Hirundo rustica rustica]
MPWQHSKETTLKDLAQPDLKQENSQNNRKTRFQSKTPTSKNKNDYAHYLQNFFVDIYLFRSSLTLKQHTCQFAEDGDDGVGCSLSKHAGGKNTERAADTPESQAAAQRDFDKLEKCADMNLMEFRERKCKVLNQERNNTKHLHMTESSQLESSFAEKDLWVLVVTMVNTSNVALQGYTNSILGSSGRVLTEGLRR